jgi:S-DNA-T family DNA segregation ATPase FtsK/SpoIIIE
MFISGLLFLASISYNPIDLVETGGTLNLLGIWGAEIAHFFLQYFGLSTYLLILFLVRWAFLIISKESFGQYKLKISGLLLSLFIFSFLVGSVKVYEFSFYSLTGGHIGFMLSDLILSTHFFILVYILSIPLLLFLLIFCLELQNVRLFAKIKEKIKLPSFKFKKSVAKEIPVQPVSPPKLATKLEKTENVDFKPTAPKIEKKITGFVHAFKYIAPPISLLSLSTGDNQKKNQKNISMTKQIEKELSKALIDFGIEATIKGARVGPVITMYEIDPKAGIRAARIMGLADDIARSLKAKSARISLIPSSSSLAIEIPNVERETVFLRELLDNPEFKESDFHIPIALGKSITGDGITVDLTSMPHLLVAGTTGSGKSVGVNTMILSILYKLSPLDCQFIMIDPKMLELSVYNDIPHLLTPVITESEKAVMALKWLTMEMERRYRRMSAFSVRNIFGYNDAVLKLKASGVENRSETNPNIDSEELKNLKKMPFIVVIIDEMADLMITAGKMIEGYIQRLAQMARAAGIHVIMATQRPSVDVITGVIKANFPTRISFQVSSKIDSRTILGMQGAEGLLGKGDMLYLQAGAKTYRIHSPFVSDDEVNNIVSYLKKTYGGVYDSLKVDIFEEVAEEGIPESSGGGMTFSPTSGQTSKKEEAANSDAELYAEALEVVFAENKPSISYVQRRLRIGYNKAANIIERMEAEGFVSKIDATGKRIVLKKG